MANPGTADDPSNPAKRVDCAVVLSTAPPDAVDGLVERLLGAGLAACVNVVPEVASRYVWEGRIESATESLLIVKTTQAQVPALIEQLAAWHPYAVPEILAIPIGAGLPSYLEWVARSCQSRG